MKVYSVVGIFLCFASISCYGMEIERAILMGGYSVQGKRKDQEDKFDLRKMNNNGQDIYGIVLADGHGGSEVADYVQKTFLGTLDQRLSQSASVKEALISTGAEIEGALLQNNQLMCAGSTGSVVCLEKTNKAHIFWVGDSRVLCRLTNGQYAVTCDHNCTNQHEKDRVTQLGGTVKNGKLSFAGNMGIEVTRSFGDSGLKDNFLEGQLIYAPEYLCINGDIDYCVCASDGFWSVLKDFNNEKIHDLVQDAFHLSQDEFYEKYNCDDQDRGELIEVADIDNGADKNLNIASKRLIDFVLSKGSDDNITVILLCNNQLETSLSDSGDLGYDSCYDSDCDFTGSTSGSVGEDDLIDLKAQLEGYLGDGSSSVSGELSSSDESNSGPSAIVLVASIESFKTDITWNELTQKANADCGSSESRKEGDNEGDFSSGLSSGEEAEQESALIVVEEKNDQQQEKLERQAEISKNPVNKSFWASLMQYKKTLLSGGITVGLLAIIYAAYHYNYISLNFMTA